MKKSASLGKQQTHINLNCVMKIIQIYVLGAEFPVNMFTEQEPAMHYLCYTNVSIKIRKFSFFFKQKILLCKQQVIWGNLFGFTVNMHIQKSVTYVKAISGNNSEFKATRRFN